MALTKLTTDLIDGTIVTSVNGSTGAVTLETGTDWQSTPKTADFTAVAGEGYFVDTTSAAITVTLPSSPTSKDEVSIVDYAGTANTNNITVTSSDNINGAADDLAINYNRGGVSMVYVDATQGWIAYNAANETAAALGSPLPSSFSVDYLVVAGSGAGGSGFYGGGGGAGGLRTSYGTTTGGGGTAETELTLSRNTGYFLTVGAGGTTGGTAAGSRYGGSGSNSVFSTITSTGGGGAGGGGAQGDSTTSDVSGKDGGSGGGAANSGSGAVGGTAVTSPVVQGYSGGTSNGAPGGGGGAGAAGSNGTSNAGGDGGTGLVVNIISTTNAATASIGEVSGSDVYFAGGGGTGGYGSAPLISSGGIGGGADGDERFSGTPNAGSPNSGGGGAGAGDASETGGTGGSGVVILRYPIAYNITVGSGVIEASGSPFTEGSDKVSVFTGGTGAITFS